eukprot:9877557-Alexandrium_andersonii.AAC.1
MVERACAAACAGAVRSMGSLTTVPGAEQALRDALRRLQIQLYGTPLHVPCLSTSRCTASPPPSACNTSGDATNARVQRGHIAGRTWSKAASPA